MLLKAASLAGRTLAGSLLGEVGFQAIWLLTEGRFAVPLFTQAGLASVLLPSIPFETDLANGRAAASSWSRLLIAAFLLLVVCLNATLVSIANDGRREIAGMSLIVLPGWFILIYAILAFDHHLKLRKGKQANGS